MEEDRIVKKEGWDLNPDNKKVNNIFEALNKLGGYCPCQIRSEDTKCPCKEYLENDNCHCNLYVKLG